MSINLISHQKPIDFGQIMSYRVFVFRWFFTVFYVLAELLAFFAISPLVFKRFSRVYTRIFHCFQEFLRIFDGFYVFRRFKTFFTLFKRLARVFEITVFSVLAT